ncbi:hypothetical protein FOL47_000504 [Perkinsus chesapeaki]|uniref:Bardet-Biedl syndrome 4 protein n=1 Tax=Perkinsus chesapeaki TaxID=330153 RepID=A0A7J6MLP3_PERCH|nr:hypothetical protein FOL47_000504 [Perkinsus chesapeaki]
MANASRLSSIHDNKRHRPASAEYKSGRDSDNWYMNALYIRHDFEECMNFIEECLKDSNGLNQHALYYKALIHRQQGDIHSSLTFFQTAACLDPLNIQYLKEVAKSLALLGQHGSALEVILILPGGWGYLGDRQAALDSFRMANDIQRHDDTCIEIAELCIHVGDIEAAIEAYNEALEFSPENTNILTRLGILLMKAGDTYRAFECLGNSLVYEPKDPKTILAAASVIQDNGDVDVALVKYRIAAIYEPFSSELWSNVGLCFFDKRKVVAAIACLKRALSLGHFQWRIYFNLGLLHLFTGQYASAFVFLSSALNLEPSSSLIFMYLGIALSRLDDFTNSRSAYARAIGNMKEATDDTSSIAPIVHLNCCITAFNHGDIEEAKKHFLIFDGIYQKLQDSAEDEDDLLHELMSAFPDTPEKRAIMGSLLLGRAGV